jgi:nucleotide-binding universal stress UspA family protein
MFPPKRLLMPVDFSAYSAPVTPMASEFARHFDGQLTILHVAPLFPEGTSELRRSWLDKFGEAEASGLHVDRVLLCSDKDVASEIVTYANQHNMDLILMPTHGYGRSGDSCLGQ